MPEPWKAQMKAKACEHHIVQNTASSAINSLGTKADKSNWNPAWKTNRNQYVTEAITPSQLQDHQRCPDKQVGIPNFFLQQIETSQRTALPSNKGATLSGDQWQMIAH